MGRPNQGQQISPPQGILTNPFGDEANFYFRAKKLIKNNNSEAVPAADRSVVASQFINQLALLAEQPDVQNDLEIGLPIFLEALILAGQAYLPEVLPEKYTKQFHHEKMVHTQEDLTVAYFNFYQFGFSLLKHTGTSSLPI